MILRSQEFRTERIAKTVLCKIADSTGAFPRLYMGFPPLALERGIRTLSVRRRFAFLETKESEHDLYEQLDQTASFTYIPNMRVAPVPKAWHPCSTSSQFGHLF